MPMPHQRDLALIAWLAIATPAAHFACNKSGGSPPGDAGQAAGAGGQNGGAAGQGGAGQSGGSVGSGASGGTAGRAGSSGQGGSVARGGTTGTGGSVARGGTTGTGGSSARGGTGGSGGRGGTTGSAGSGGRGGTTGTAGSGGQALGPLRVDSVNARYFTDGSGKAIYLTGSHTWGNFKDRAHTDPPPAFNYTAFLDFLVAHHHNFIRLWTWEQPHSFDDDPQNLLYFTPFPWQRTGPGTASDGKPRFDLDKPDPAYFTRLHDRVAAARDRGIYVAVMLFDGWDLTNAYNPTSGGFPFGSGNNVNGVAVTGPAS